MRRGQATFALLVAVGVLVIAGILGALIAQVGRPFPGFFFTIDSRIFPVEPSAHAAGLAYGDRIVSVDGQPPLGLMSRVEAATGPVRYEVERGGKRLTVALAPTRFTWHHLVDRFAGYFVVSSIMLAPGWPSSGRTRRPGPTGIRAAGARVPPALMRAADTAQGRRATARI